MADDNTMQAPEPAAEQQAQATMPPQAPSYQPQNLSNIFVPYAPQAMRGTLPDADLDKHYPGGRGTLREDLHADTAAAYYQKHQADQDAKDPKKRAISNILGTVGGVVSAIAPHRGILGLAGGTGDAMLEIARHMNQSRKQSADAYNNNLTNILKTVQQLEGTDPKLTQKIFEENEKGREADNKALMGNANAKMRNDQKIERDKWEEDVARMNAKVNQDNSASLTPLRQSQIKTGQQNADANSLNARTNSINSGTLGQYRQQAGNALSQQAGTAHDKAAFQAQHDAMADAKTAFDLNDAPYKMATDAIEKSVLEPYEKKQQHKIPTTPEEDKAYVEAHQKHQQMYNLRKMNQQQFLSKFQPQTAQGPGGPVQGIGYNQPGQGAPAQGQPAQGQKSSDVPHPMHLRSAKQRAQQLLDSGLTRQEAESVMRREGLIQ